MGTNGGQRAGAGRKPKTGKAMVVKRIPEQLVPAIDQLITQLQAANRINMSNKLPNDAYYLADNVSSLTIPLSYEKIPAGFPSPAEPYVHDYLDFNEYLVKNRAATIAVRCGGESMRDAGISKNDLLIIDRSLTPSNKDIVMADIGNEYTIKRLYISNTGAIELRPENSTEEFPIFRFSEGDELTIVGVVTHIIKDIR